MAQWVRHAREFTLAAVVMGAGAIVGLGACAVEEEEGVIESQELVGASEDVGSSEDAISGSYSVGTVFKTTSDLNLRSGPDTSYSIVAVMPNASAVSLLVSSPSNTKWYKVNFNGLVGYASGLYLTTVSSTNSKRELAITRAAASKGFSYWWGHGRFRGQGPTSSTKGSCSGSCPSCTHSGSYGGDCSGLAAKVWQVPSSNTVLTTDSHPYSTANFNVDSSQWSTVSRSNMKMADAMVYRSNGAGHIFIYKSGDGWGSMYAYECKGCSAGCVYNLRTASSSYHGIRRTGY